jgi:AraC family transcriptional regulator
MDVSPPHIVSRHTFALDGLVVETVEATSCERIECRFRAPHHLLAVCDRGMRDEGETFVEGLPRSSLRDLRKKLTFVPAGHDYHESQKPRIGSRVTYFYIDPSTMPVDSGVGASGFAPRLYFEDAALWETTQKISAFSNSSHGGNRLYLQALVVMLKYELVQLCTKIRREGGPIRGGLAGWQKRTVSTYIDEHLGEHISLATLAKLARLSTWHFCRAFKQSFGVTPHRYHTNCRIEWAKSLLAERAASVTDIGLTVGYSETSSFSAAFRKATGCTPTDYHRNL